MPRIHLSRHKKRQVTSDSRKGNLRNLLGPPDAPIFTGSAQVATLKIRCDVILAIAPRCLTSSQLLQREITYSSCSGCEFCTLCLLYRNGFAVYHSRRSNRGPLRAGAQTRPPLDPGGFFDVPVHHAICYLCREDWSTCR